MKYSAIFIILAMFHCSSDQGKTDEAESSNASCDPLAGKCPTDDLNSLDSSGNETNEEENQATDTSDPGTNADASGESSGEAAAHQLVASSIISRHSENASIKCLGKFNSSIVIIGEGKNNVLSMMEIDLSTNAVKSEWKEICRPAGIGLNCGQNQHNIVIYGFTEKGLVQVTLINESGVERNFDFQLPLTRDFFTQDFCLSSIHQLIVCI